MSQIEVTIVRADTGAAFDVQLPDDQQVSSILSEVVSAMGLPRLGPDGDVIAYELSNKRTGDWVRDGTLESKGIKIGDCLLLTSTFVAGSHACRYCGTENPNHGAAARTRGARGAK